jgi:hypothetical protein
MSLNWKIWLRLFQVRALHYQSYYSPSRGVCMVLACRETLSIPPIIRPRLPMNMVVRVPVV